MTEKPISLDGQRGMAAQKETEIRRMLAKVEANEAELRARLEGLEAQLLSSPATTWPEAADKARYLIKLLGESPAGQDPRRQILIARVLDDFDRLSKEITSP